MEDQRKQAIQDAIRTLSPDQFTGSGKPKLDALNAAMPDGQDEVTSAERDEAWADMPGDDQSDTSDQSDTAPAADDAGDDAGETTTADFGSGQLSGHPEGDGAAAGKPTYSVDNLPGANVETDSHSPETDGGETKRIRLTSAPSDPLTGYVHGLGSYSLRVGEEHEVRVELLDAIDATEARYEEVDNG